MSIFSHALGLDHQKTLLAAINSALKAIARACGLPTTEADLHTDVNTAVSAAANVAALTGGQKVVGLVSAEIDKAPLPDAEKSHVKTVAADAILNGALLNGALLNGAASALKGAIPPHGKGD